LKPDWGKPAVRNFRGEDGNGSYRAILLPEVQRRSVADLVSESLIRGNCPVDAVVISTSGKGMTDLSESVEVNVLCKEG